MANIGDLNKILNNELLQSFLCKDYLKLTEIFVLIRLLISLNIPFEFSFSERRKTKEAYITFRIKLSPSSTFEHVFSLEN